MTSLQAQGYAGAMPKPHIGILINADGALGIAAMLIDAADLTTIEAESVLALTGLAQSGSVDAVVLDPELGDGWPIDIAEQVAVAVRGIRPLIVVCRQAHDAQLIKGRTAGNSVFVLHDAGLTPEKLIAVVKGAIATHQARSGV